MLYLNDMVGDIIPYIAERDKKNIGREREHSVPIPSFKVHHETERCRNCWVEASWCGCADDMRVTHPLGTKHVGGRWEGAIEWL